MTVGTQTDAVELVCSHIDRGQREGRRTPGRPALIEATGLTDRAVRTALDKIREGTTGSEEPRKTASGVAGPRRPQTASAGDDANSDDHQTRSRPDDHQRTNPAGNCQPTASSRRPALRSTSPAATTGEHLATPHLDTNGAGHQRSSLRKVGHLSPSSASAESGDRAGGTAVSWLGFAFGSVTSIAGNVLHTWLPADTQPPGWTPGFGPQVGASVWPVALIVTVEVLARVRWRHTWFWRVIRYGIGTVVAIGSFTISYVHIHGVLTAWHYDPVSAAIGPLVLDGLMTISGLALLTGDHNGSKNTRSEAPTP